MQDGQLINISPETPQSAPATEVVVAALEEALQNARLLRVSSSLFLKEAKELLDLHKVMTDSELSSIPSRYMPASVDTLWFPYCRS
jgi:predicted neuraminidase